MQDRERVTVEAQERGTVDASERYVTLLM